MSRNGLFAVIALCAMLFSGVVAPRASAITDDEREEQIAAALYDFVCAGDGKKERSYRWYSEYVDIQGRNPYTVKGADTNLFVVALNTRYDAHHGFNPWSRQQMCGDPGFGEWVKQVAVARKGKIKSCCATEKGLADFFAQKLQAMIDLMEREDQGDDPYDTLWKCDDYQGECQSGKY